MPRPDAAVNDAHQSIWSSTGVDLHLSDFLIALALLAIISAQNDWALRLANLAYLPLFASYVLRTTFFWPVVVAYNFLETPRLQQVDRPAVRSLVPICRRAGRRGGIPSSHG